MCIKTSVCLAQSHPLNFQIIPYEAEHRNRQSELSVVRLAGSRHCLAESLPYPLLLEWIRFEENLEMKSYI